MADPAFFFISSNAALDADALTVAPWSKAAKRSSRAVSSSSGIPILLPGTFISTSCLAAESSFVRLERSIDARSARRDEGWKM